MNSTHNVTNTHMYITKRQLGLVTGLFIVWRLTLFLIGGLADFFLKYAPSFPYYDSLLLSYHFPRWIYSWANFDGVHYLTIAQKGYIGTGLVQAFFPLLPFVLLHLPYQLFQGHLNVLLLGLVLTHLFTWLFCVVWFAFVQERKGTQFAWVSLLCILTFPTAFFFGALYTESLFLLLCVSAFWLAQKQRWLLASIMVLLAASTRLVGIFLLPALIIELWMQWYSKLKKKQQKAVGMLPLLFLQQQWHLIGIICCSGFGLLLYMTFLYREFHDPFYFLHVQSAFGAGRQTTLVLYPQVVFRAVRILQTVTLHDWKYFAYLQEFVVGTLGLIGVVWSYKEVRASEFFFAICAFILPTLTGTFSSVPRYILVCFPIYLFLTQFIHKSRARSIVWFAISSILLIINTVLFIQGYWVA